MLHSFGLLAVLSLFHGHEVGRARRHTSVQFWHQVINDRTSTVQYSVNIITPNHKIIIFRDEFWKKNTLMRLEMRLLTGYSPISLGGFWEENETAPFGDTSLMIDEDLRTDDFSIRSEHALQLFLIHGLGQVGDEHVGVLNFIAGTSVCASRNREVKYTERNIWVCVFMHKISLRAAKRRP